MKSIEEKMDQWLTSTVIDEDVKAEIRSMSKDEIQDAFYKDLEFGTGGLRGVMGPGSNRMNKYVVGTATQGMSNYLKLQFPEKRISVAIAYDSRNNSDYFAQITANVFSSNGIQVYLFDGLRPTPELSFAIRELGCQSGIVITASHNPREYNGYKAYWSDGGQLVPPHDHGVINEVRKIESFEAVNFDPNSQLITKVGHELDEKFLQTIQNLSLTPDIDHSIRIVYSSIHGTGITLIPEALKRFGFTNVETVAEQAEPNGDFPTVVYPNPEEEEAMKMALEKARKIDADLVMATDPDADRVGIGVKNLDSTFQLLNGNQAAAILVYYLLKRKSEIGLQGNEFISKTIVTSDLLTTIADHFGVKTYETLTGFKYIAELIRLKEGQEQFLGGGEESYGYMISDAVRDKDAVASCAMLAEAAGWAHKNGKTMFELLVDIYCQFGFYKERLHSMTRKGQSGAEEIQSIMKKFRADPPKELAGSPVVYVLDYQAGIGINKRTGKEEQLNFPQSNVLQFLTADGSRVSVRPSGTEPKIKFYFSTKTDLESASEYDQKLDQLEEKLDSLQNDVLG